MIDLKKRYMYSAIGGLAIGVVVSIFMGFWFFIPVFLISTGGLASIYIVNEAHGLIVETFGAFTEIKKPGIRLVWFPGICQTAVDEVYTMQRKIAFFEGDMKTVDFIDGSVNPNDCHILLEIHSPFEEFTANNNKLQTGIYRFHYNVKDCESVVVDRIEGCLRAILNPKTVDEGLIEKGVNLKKDIFKDHSIEEEFHNWGVDLKAVILGDFELLPETRESRAAVYNAKKKAEIAHFQSEERSESITGALLEMVCDMTGIETRQELTEALEKNPEKYQQTIEHCSKLLVRRMGLDHNAIKDIRIEGLPQGGADFTAALALFKILGEGMQQATETLTEKKKGEGRKFTDEEYDKKFEKMYEGKAI
jgi:regulator of protease activity HflC (stomatin/prohibitin superfamily)